MSKKPHLTARQLEVLKLLGDGMSIQEIAEALGISKRGVDSHLASIYVALKVNSRTQAYVAALRLGLVKPPRRTN